MHLSLPFLLLAWLTVSAFGLPSQGKVDALGQTTGYVYDATLRARTKTTTPRGIRFESSYDASRRLTQSCVYNGGVLESKTTYEYGSEVFAGFRTLEVRHRCAGDPEGSAALATAFAPDSRGRVRDVAVDASGLALTTSYTYDLEGRVLSVKDARAQTTSFEYEYGRLWRTTLPGGATRTLAYDAAGNVTSETNERGAVTTHAYDALHRLTRTDVVFGSNPAGGVQGAHVTWAYNARNQVVSRADLRGAEAYPTTYDYDGIGRLVALQRGTQSTQYEYGANSGGSLFASRGFYPTSITDPNGNVTTVVNDKLYRAKTVSRTAGGTTVADHDKDGNVVKVVDALGRATVSQYDGLGRAVKVTHADGTVTQAAYTCTGRVWKSVDEMGHTTLFEYDGADRLRRTILPAVGGVSPVVEQSYDANGNVIGAKDARGQVTLLEYDERNRCVKVTSPKVYDPTAQSWVAPVVLTEYDAAGNAVKVTDPRGFATQTTYDLANRPIKVSAPLGVETTRSYDANGNVLTVTDANGHVTTNVYDPSNRLQSTTDGAGVVTTFGYDENGNRTSITDGKGQVTTFTYDGQNRVLSEEYANGDDVAFTYDAVHLRTRVDAKGTTSYEYDLRGRLKTETLPGAPRRTYAYDRAGRMLWVSEAGNAAANVVYGYDALGRLTSETSRGQTQSHQYELGGNRIASTYSTGRVETRSYDGGGRLVKQVSGSAVTRFYYDVAGQAVAQWLPNGQYEWNVRDALGRLTQRTVVRLAGSQASSGSARAVFTWKHDKAGNVIEQKEAWPGEPLRAAERRTTMDYDGANRLLEETVYETGQATKETLYTYDAASNRLSKVEKSGGVTQKSASYTYNTGNQLTAWTENDSVAGLVRDAVLSYDGNGNRTSQTITLSGAQTGVQTTTYGWTPENRLESVTLPNLDVHSYEYDYRARRISRSEPDGAGGSVDTAVVYSGGLSVAERGNVYTAPAEPEGPPGPLLEEEYPEEPALPEWPVLLNDPRPEVEYQTVWNSETEQWEEVPVYQGQVEAQAEWDAAYESYYLAYAAVYNEYIENLVACALEHSAEGVAYYVMDSTYANEMIGGWNGTPEERFPHYLNWVHDLIYALEITEGEYLNQVANGTYLTAEGREEVLLRLEVIVLPTAPETGVLSGPVATEYHRGPDMGGGVGGLLYTERNGVARYNLGNGRGDVVAQSDADGALTWTASYEAYGKRPVETGTNLDRQRANTKEEDPTGLIYNDRRYRDLETGVWLSRDPAGFVDGPNLYAYVRQNPWTAWDPDGLNLVTQLLKRGLKVISHDADGVARVGGRRITDNMPKGLKPGDTFHFDPNSALGREFKDGVKFDSEGWIELSRYSKKDVQIEMTGDNKVDFPLADKEAGITEAYRKENNLTWHHHQDGETMQLVRKELNAISHTGGAAVARAAKRMAAEAAENPAMFVAGMLAPHSIPALNKKGGTFSELGKAVVKDIGENVNPGFDLVINKDNAIRLNRAIDPNGDYSGPEYNYDSKPKIDWGEGWRLFVNFITNRDLKK